MAVIVAVGNQKGGVGKTTTVHATLAALAKRAAQKPRSRIRLLGIDLDPQCTFTQSCGVPEDDVIGHSMYDVLGDARKGKRKLQSILMDVADGFTLAPSCIDLAQSEAGLMTRMVNRDLVLRAAIESVIDDFDFIMIDCPPSLGMLTVNALMTANGVVVPTKPLVSDLRGVRLFRDTIAQVQEANVGLRELGILVTNYDSRLVEHRHNLSVMQEDGLPLFKTMIGASIRVAEAPARGQSVISFAPDNRCACEYNAFAEELLECLMIR